jgi:hypothetical protein
MDPGNYRVKKLSLQTYGIFLKRASVPCFRLPPAPFIRLEPVLDKASGLPATLCVSQLFSAVHQLYCGS